MDRSLIAGVGHRFWGDFSAGPVWVDRLAKLDWPESVTVEDYSFGAVAMTQQLQDERFDRAAFVTAESRQREPGSLHLTRHTSSGESPERVQAYVNEAGGGVVAIDALLVIAEHFEALPPETWILELEPFDDNWGDGLSPEADAHYPRVVELLRAFARGDRLSPGEIAGE